MAGFIGFVEGESTSRRKEGKRKNGGIKSEFPCSFLPLTLSSRSSSFSFRSAQNTIVVNTPVSTTREGSGCPKRGEEERKGRGGKSEAKWREEELARTAWKGGRFLHLGVDFLSPAWYWRVDGCLKEFADRVNEGRGGAKTSSRPELVDPRSEQVTSAWLGL